MSSSNVDLEETIKNLKFNLFQAHERENNLRSQLTIAERKISSKEFNDQSLKDEIRRYKLDIDRLKWELNWKVKKLTREKEEMENELTCLRKSYSALESKFNTVKARCLNFFGLEVTD